MADALLRTLRATLPPEIRDVVEEHLLHIEDGNFSAVLSCDDVKDLLDLKHCDNTAGVAFNEDEEDWNDFVFRRLNLLLNKPYLDFPLELSRTYKQHLFFLAAVAALQLFVQISVTGPPLEFSLASLLLPPEIAQDQKRLRSFRDRLISSRNVDGIAAYRLTPSPELLCLADTILAAPAIKKNVTIASWATLRTLTLHQRVLSETSSTLQDQIEQCLSDVVTLPAVLENNNKRDVETELLLERSAVHLYHGSDKEARDTLQEAQNRTRLQFVLTGQLGKRTRFQEKETSQLVVLARSHADNLTDRPQEVEGGGVPQTVNLDDDTLLDSISFDARGGAANRIGHTEASNVPEILRELDPNAQPQLQPLDSVILLLLAASITTRSPVDGLTREETLPYALRVLEGGSSNWQIYTQALLLRSRIEGYKSRTAERGLLQLQALVDQIIADTDDKAHNRNGDVQSMNDDKSAPSTFLPLPQALDSATASQRLRYVYSLSTPTRWELETELAMRWTAMGGLRSALDIYERLEMWPEAALCWAATDREDKAKRIIKRQLNYPSAGAAAHVEEEDEEEWDGPPREPLPLDAPRLYCILGDLSQDPAMWRKAWDVSNGRYARAQRSLGRFYFAKGEADKAAEAYAHSLKVNQLNGQTWFAYGCCLLELSRFGAAVEAFARTVQLDDQDAEAWSNLAAALVKRGPRQPSRQTGSDRNRDETIQDKEREANGGGNSMIDSQQHLRDALRAFKRAATLKQDSARIYDNVLTVAVSLNPPAYTDAIAAQRRIIELRGNVEGESCIEEDIIDLLVRHVVTNHEPPSQMTITEPENIPDATTALQVKYRPGSLPALVIELLSNHIQPLITRSARLWLAVAKLSVWRDHSATALDAHEKAWRIVVAQEGWTRGDVNEFESVVQSTLDLVDAYESLGVKERTEGLAAGSGQLVAKDWKFKARSAVRNVIGKSKEMFEGTDGFERLQVRMSELKGG